MICRQRGRLAGWGVPRLELAASALPFSVHYWRAGNGVGGLFVCFVLVHIYLFIYFRHSNFEQILSSETGMALGQTHSTVREET